MSRVRSINTAPEIIVRKSLHKLGYRFRLHRKDMAGRPDIILPKYHAVIFVNGCFWHHHSHCRKSKLPNSNRRFWKTKIQKNVKRDKINNKLLIKQGWRVLTIWGM